MIHPATELRLVDPEIGYGVFATTYIPKGTIVYVKDEMEIVIREGDVLHSNPLYRMQIDKYSYTEPDGSKVLSWDIAKYVNHSCDANTMSTGYGFEIATRDIHPGEQITDDYGLLNIEEPMSCCCGSHACRKTIGINEFDSLYEHWDDKVRQALALFNDVEQPLHKYLESIMRERLAQYLDEGEHYLSVRTLEYIIRQPHVA